MNVYDSPPADVVPADNARVDASKTEYYRRLIVWRMVKEVPYSDRPKTDSLMGWAHFLESLAKEWGFKCPKAILKMAERGEAEIAAVTLPPPKKAK